jgi:hypothetical protein
MSFRACGPPFFTYVSQSPAVLVLATALAVEGPGTERFGGA